LACGANPNERQKGRTPLHAAAEFEEDASIWNMQRTSAEHSRIVGLQLSDPLRTAKQVKYPWTEEKNNDEQVTTIVNEHDTCQIQEIVRLLLSAGTNLTELDINEHTALDVAVKTKCEPVVTELCH
jgi:ankyrin repeat protein